MIPVSRAPGLVVAAVGLILAGPAGAQRVQKESAPPRPDTTRYAVTLGPDTLAKERVIRGEARLDGDLRLLRPQAMVVQYTVFLRRDGTADSLHSTQVSGAAAARAGIVFRGDSAVLTMHAPGLVEPRVVRIAATPGALPFINLSAGILDQIFRRARIAGGNDVVIPLLAGPRELPGRVRFTGPDSAVLDLGVELRAAVGADGALRGAVVPAQGVRFARMTSALAVQDGSSPADTRPGHAAPAGAPYTARDVVVTTPSGVALAGTLTLPAWASPSRPAPVVVTISGSGAQNRDSELAGLPGYGVFRQLADTLGRRGVGVLRLDDRGAGASAAGGGDATTGDFADDVHAAVQWLRTRPEVDGARIGLVGHSEGGLVAPLVAVRDTGLAAIALLAAPSRPGRELSAHQRRIAIAQEPTIPAGARDSLFRLRQAEADSVLTSGGGDAWSRFWWTYDPRPTARRVRIPVLVLHGETDMQVPPAQARELVALLRASGNPEVVFHPFPGVNHLFLEDASGHWAGYAALPSRSVPPVIMGTLADWFAMHLGMPPRR